MGLLGNVSRKDLLTSAHTHAQAAEEAAQEVDMHLGGFRHVLPDNDDVASFDRAVVAMAQRGLAHAATSQAYSALLAALRPGDLTEED